MPKGPKGEKRPADVVGAAVKVMRIATGEISEDIDGDGKDKAAQAHRLDWDGLDLFGAHPTAPVARMDAMGLVPLLSGRPVVALSTDEAAIRTPSGGTLTYRRHRPPPAGRCLVWDLPA